MKRYSFITLLILIFIISSISYAGSMFEVQCTDTSCGFKTSISIGGGFNFGQITGYCRKCNEPVYIQWKIIKYVREKEPDPTMLFWDPTFGNGKIRRIYKCPKCDMPFIEITNIDDFHYCPKCRKPTITPISSMIYD
jgi:hypothetical protein